MTNAEARFSNSLRPRKPEGSLGRTAQDGHLDSHTAPELWPLPFPFLQILEVGCCSEKDTGVAGVLDTDSIAIYTLILFWNHCGTSPRIVLELLWESCLELFWNYCGRCARNCSGVTVGIMPRIVLELWWETCPDFVWNYCGKQAQNCSGITVGIVPVIVL